MLLSSRIVNFRALPGVIVPAASGICDRVKELAGVDVTLWAAGPGYPTGTMVWSTMVESHAHYAEVTGKVAEDQQYTDLVDELIQHAPNYGEQILRELIHATAPPEGSPPLGAAAWVISAQIAPGQIGNAMTWAVEIAEIAKATTGNDVALLRDLYGPWGVITWISVVDNMSAVDEANAKLSESADYMGKVDAGGDLFVPSGARSGILTRIH